MSGKPYQCGLCQRRFPSIDELRRHFYGRHERLTGDSYSGRPTKGPGPGNRQGFQPGNLQGRPR